MDVFPWQVARDIFDYGQLFSPESPFHIFGPESNIQDLGRGIQSETALYAACGLIAGKTYIHSSVVNNNSSHMNETPRCSM